MNIFEMHAHCRTIRGTQVGIQPLRHADGRGLVPLGPLNTPQYFEKPSRHHIDLPHTTPADVNFTTRSPPYMIVSEGTHTLDDSIPNHTVD